MPRESIIGSVNDRIILIYSRDEKTAGELRAKINTQPGHRAALRAAKFYGDEQELCHEVVVMPDVIKFHPEVAERIRYRYELPRESAPRGTVVHLMSELVPPGPVASAVKETIQPVASTPEPPPPPPSAVAADARPKPPPPSPAKGKSGE